MRTGLALMVPVALSLVGMGASSAAADEAPQGELALGAQVVEHGRDGRDVKFKVWYPREGGGTDTQEGAEVAEGEFPLILFSHGLGGNPDSYSSVIAPLAAAGFIVAAPWYQGTTTGTDTPDNGDVWEGEQSKDASSVITRMLEMDGQEGSPFEGHIDESRGVGASGHSMGAMTTQGLIGSQKDDRVTSVAMLAVASIGDVTGSEVKSLIVNGENDPLTAYDGARQIYDQITWPKAFLTHVGGNHDSFIWNGQGYDQTIATVTDWMRWSLYGDDAALDRLPSDASGDQIEWESEGLEPAADTTAAEEAAPADAADSRPEAQATQEEGSAEPAESSDPAPQEEATPEAAEAAPAADDDEPAGRTPADDDPSGAALAADEEADAPSAVPVEDFEASQDSGDTLPTTGPGDLLYWAAAAVAAVTVGAWLLVMRRRSRA